MGLTGQGAKNTKEYLILLFNVLSYYHIYM